MKSNHQGKTCDSTFTEENLRELRTTVINMMQELHGESYAYGWVRSAYINGWEREVEIRVLLNTLQELETTAEENLKNIRNDI